MILTMPLTAVSLSNFAGKCNFVDSPHTPTLGIFHPMEKPVQGPFYKISLG